MKRGLGYDEVATLKRAYRKLIRRYVRVSASYPHSAERHWDNAEKIRKVIEEYEGV